MSRFGRVDIPVNNAGVSKLGELLTYSPEDWHEVYETNVAECFFLSQVVLPTMKRQTGAGSSTLHRSTALLA